MMEKIEKYIIYSSEDKALIIDQKYIEKYLSEVKVLLKRTIIGLTGMPDVRITLICFWIMLSTRQKPKK